MPYKSEAQRRFLHAKHPDIAARWDRKYSGKIKARPKGAQRAVKARAPSQP